VVIQPLSESCVDSIIVVASENGLRSLKAVRWTSIFLGHSRISDVEEMYALLCKRPMRIAVFLGVDLDGFPLSSLVTAANLLCCGEQLKLGKRESKAQPTSCTFHLT
jgi:orotate phosphoribosyltransferase-like protein